MVMLACYDAELSYDPQFDTFQARYPPHGRRAVAIETGIQWERLRAAPVDTPPHDLHASDCLNDLHPGDHIEIQWRRNKEFPYGWWYGVVGHLESCDGNENYCRCHSSASLQRCTGLGRMEEVLHQYRWPKPLESDFIYGSSSIGTSVNAQFLATFSAAAVIAAGKMNAMDSPNRRYPKKPTQK